MAEREIKTVLTLEDASFTKGLKQAAGSVNAAKAEMNAAISSAGGLGKGLKQAAAHVKGLSNVIKAQKNQMGVLNKEYNTQKNRLNDLKKAAEAARKENGEGSKEAEEAANAYAYQSAKVDDLRVKMANLTTEMNKNKDALKDKFTAPLRAAGGMLKSFAGIAVTALAAGGAALTKFTIEANESKKSFNISLADSRATFGEWSLFLEEEAKKAWQSLGLSQAAYMQTAAEIGQKLQEGGMSVQQSAEWVSQAMELAGQLSEKYGIPVQTVLQDIAKAADGDKDALKRYGVEVKGINDKMTASETAAATLNAAMESAKQSADFLDGQVAQSVNSAGEKLAAAWDNFKAGTGSAEDVAKAAAEAASAFGVDFTKNLATFIKLAQGTFSTFASDFKKGWKDQVWPDIQNLFKTQFNVELPSWSDLVQGLQDTWSMVQELITGFFEIPFVIGLPKIDDITRGLSDIWEGIKSWWNKNVTPLFVTVQEKVDQFNEDTKDNFRFYPNAFAGGLWNVPRNDYMARLHTGEMVLTAAQAARYRAQAAAGGSVNNYNDSSAIYIDKYYQNSETDAQALLNAMSVMQRRQRRGYGMA